MTNAFQTQIISGSAGVQDVVSRLHRGECVALPTETVYGLAADAADQDAVNRIFDAKGRPKNHPLIVHLPDASHVQKWAKNVPERACQLAECYWPGPLTMLLERADHVSTTVTGGLDTIALRVPSHPLFLDVLRQFGGGLAAPSANRYKQLSPTTAEHVIKGLNGRIAAVLNGGPCEHGLESTIVDMLASQPRIVRAGPVTRASLEATLGCPVAMPADFDDVVPGNVEAHYQPNTPLYTATTEQIAQQLSTLRDKNVQLVVWSQALLQRCQGAQMDKLLWQSLPDSPAEFGRQLYATLYQIDQHGADSILMELPPQTDDWRATNDRLRRAARPDAG